MISLGVAAGFLSTIAGIAIFYWRLADRRLRPIDEHSTWYKQHYEEKKLAGDVVEGTISSVTCHKPDSKQGLLKRYLLLDTGRIETSILLQPGVPNKFWEEMGELLEDEDGVEVKHYDTVSRKQGSYIRLEIDRLDADYFEEVVSLPVSIVDEAAKEDLENRENKISVNVEYL